MGTYKPKNNQDFIETMAKEGCLWAYINDLPLPAMVACACGESGFGTSHIYIVTGCPFNLQKPKDWKYPECKIIPLQTINKQGEKPKLAPFCRADSLGDAARLWCEWILHWPNGRNRTLLLAYIGSPKEFARNLHLVGFAEGKRANTEKFAKLIDAHDLLKYDAKAMAKDIWGLE